MTNQFTQIPLLISIISSIFLSCSAEEEEKVTGTIMEYEFVDEGYDMDDEPEVVRYFFQLDPKFIGDEFCYDSEDVQEVLLDDDSLAVNETPWNNYEIDTVNNYLLLENQECFVTLEFSLFEMNDKKHAYLNQVSKSSQRFDHLVFNTRKEEWIKRNDLPTPELSEYFKELSEKETEIVNSYGYQFIYMKPHTDTLKCLFSEWKMGMELNYEGIKFDKGVNYSFSIIPTDSGFVKIREEK